MRLVLGSYYLDAPGGAVTYLATAARELQHLGHDVHAFTHYPGDMAERLERDGISICGPGSLPETADAVLVQDSATAYELAERLPDVGQVFVCHGGEFALDVPPQVPGVVGVVVVLNDRVRRRIEAMALDVQVVRLRQPIDYARFFPRGEPRERPERAVLLGNYLRGARRDAVTAALERAGIEWRQLGRFGEPVADPAPALSEADILIGYGRSALEGMSSGCAVYVYEYSLDGWVTAETYPAMEANGFAGTAFEIAPDPDRFERDLALYEPGMGLVNRELVVTRHYAIDHANELVGLLARVGERRTQPQPHTEMARLVRLQWEERMRVGTLERLLADQQQATHEAQERAVRAEKRAHEAEGRLEEIRRSLRYRMGQGLVAPLERLRSRRR